MSSSCFSSALNSSGTGSSMTSVNMRRSRLPSQSGTCSGGLAAAVSTRLAGLGFFTHDHDAVQIVAPAKAGAWESLVGRRNVPGSEKVPSVREPFPLFIHSTTALAFRARTLSAIKNHRGVLHGLSPCNRRTPALSAPLCPRLVRHADERRRLCAGMSRSDRGRYIGARTPICRHESGLYRLFHTLWGTTDPESRPPAVAQARSRRRREAPERAHAGPSPGTAAHRDGRFQRQRDRAHPRA